MKLIINFLVLSAITGLISSASTPSLNKAKDNKKMLGLAHRPGNSSDYPKERDVVLTVTDARQVPTAFTFPLNIWKDPGLLIDTNMGSPAEMSANNKKNGVEKKDIHSRYLSNDAIT